MTSPAQVIGEAGGLFVAGTGTEVGKTVVAACLVRALDADYWKPVQTGLDDGTDSDTVTRLLNLERGRLHASAYALRAPLSPDQAAALENVAIALDRIAAPETGRPLVVEGAGGLLVPLNERETMIDLAARLGLPVLLVAVSGLGTINHTLLSLEALRARDLPVLGVIMNGPPHAANAEAVRTFGRIPVLFELPPLEPLDRAAIDGVAAGFRRALEASVR